jgi:hypothetical protein
MFQVNLRIATVCISEGLVRNAGGLQSVDREIVYPCPHAHRGDGRPIEAGM